jgi:hypothetical protein
MRAVDGKMRLTAVADAEHILRLVEFLVRIIGAKWNKVLYFTS